MRAGPIVLCVLLSVALRPDPASAVDIDTRPNILWIYIEDQSPWYGCYGEKLIATPNIDALAGDGVLFERAYVATPVCSPSRSALITGSYPIRIGAHDHRSSRTPGAEIHLPAGAKTVPELFRDAGYATFNRGKDDYNFVYDRTKLYSIDGNTEHGWKGPMGKGDWRDVPKGVPFFGQYQWNGGKLANGPMGPQLANVGIEPVNPASVTVPPQYPDIPELRDVIAEHLGTILMTDHQLGQLVNRLKEDGLWENTVVFLFSDHGSDLPRSKEFCYEEGLRVPLIIAAAGMNHLVQPGARRRDLASTMDVAATSLALAGIEVPDYMDSQNLFATDYRRDHIFSSADRMSNTIDRSRSVIGDRYHYVRNFMTDRPLMQWGHREMIGKNGRRRYGYFIKLRQMFEQGELTVVQAAPYGPRPAEELYDLRSDPHEVVNLAAKEKFKKPLDELRGALATWIETTDDKGQYPRSRASIDAVKNRYPESWLAGPEFNDL